MTHAFNRYGSIASEIYDLDKPFHKLPDTAFYLSRLSGVTGEILEPACGSGRTLIPLLQAGHRVTGFDTSAEMLAQCRQRCDALGLKADVSQQSFESFEYDRKFSAIILPVSSFTLIADFKIASTVLKRFANALETGGRLIVDVTTISALIDRGADRRQWRSSNGDLLTLEGHRIQTLWMNQTIQTAYRYERWRDGQLIETQIDLMQQRFWGVEELRLLLEASGFLDISLTSDYQTGKAITSNARSLTFEARRHA